MREPKDILIPIRTRPQIEPTEECICGRLRSRIHCPTCGSYVVYVRRDFNIKIGTEDGLKYRVPTFRCRRCGTFFDQDEWLFACNAPNEQLIKPNRSSKGEAPSTTVKQIRTDGIPDSVMDVINKFNAEKCRDCGKLRSECSCKRF